MDLTQHLTRQMAFSRGTFGPGARMQGCIDHIKKELHEVEASGGAPDEWTDVVVLAFDGLTRSLAARFPALTFPTIADMAVAEILKTQGRNELRDWPDWRTADPNKAIEHRRDGERETP